MGSANGVRPHILGGVDIAPDTIFTILDLTIVEVNDPDLPDAAYYHGTDTIELNKYYLNTYSSNVRQMAITHELGHALGLGHSYWENIMYFAGAPQTVLGTQDVADYDYCWIDDNCTGQNF